jgi:hypothetical protein
MQRVCMRMLLWLCKCFCSEAKATFAQYVRYNASYMRLMLDSSFYHLANTCVLTKGQKPLSSKDENPILIPNTWQRVQIPAFTQKLTQGKNHSCKCISRTIHTIPWGGKCPHTQTWDISLLLDSGFCHLANTRVLAKWQKPLSSNCVGNISHYNTMHSVFCYRCLSELKTRNPQSLQCQMCRGNAVDIIRHERRLNTATTSCNTGGEIMVEQTGWCNWAMDTFSYSGIGNPHQEWCVMSHITFRKHLWNCQHEGCRKSVHRSCQEDWLQHHWYPSTGDDDLFCREHNEHYVRWVRFRAGKIPRSQNGCCPKLFLIQRTIRNIIDQCSTQLFHYLHGVKFYHIMISFNAVLRRTFKCHISMLHYHTVNYHITHSRYWHYYSTFYCTFFYVDTVQNIIVHDVLYIIT